MGILSAVLAYGIAWALGGRPPGVFWLNAPLVLVLGGAAWLSRRPGRGAELAVGWTVGSGLASTIGLATRTGSSNSPVLPILILLMVFAFRFFERRQAMWGLVTSLLGVLALIVMDAVGVAFETHYVHTAVESGTILGAVLVLSGLLLVLDWDERAATVAQLRAASRRLSAVNDVLRITRAEAIDRARQQQALARLSMAAFEGASSHTGAVQSSAALEEILTRCCATIVDELLVVQVTIQQKAVEDGLGPRVACTLEPSSSAGDGGPSGVPKVYSRWHDWQVTVDGASWGVLRVAWHDEGNRGLTADQRLFVDGVCTLVSAVVGRHTTMGALRRTESQLVEAQRLEGVAFMASGVVHDLNNALTCIIGNTQLALEAADSGRVALEELRDVERAALGAREVCRQLLDTARRPGNDQDWASLPELVGDVMRTMRRTIGDNIWVDCDVADIPGCVHMSPGKAEQVILNLLVNARDAMPNGGHLLVSLGPVKLPNSGRSGWLELSVQDTGVGIPEELHSRIFEPLFTTKGNEGGTGLGLATVASIVREAGGHVQVDSSVGTGTTFRVRLPTLEVEAETAKIVVVGAADLASDVRAPGILIVEDDAQVRASVTRSLQRYGYDVFEASGPDQALDLFERHGDNIDLLLTDFSMPRMDGLELGRQLRLRSRELPMLVVTGWADSARFRESGHPSWDRLLEKPFTSEELRDKVDELLGRRPMDAPRWRTG